MSSNLKPIEWERNTMRSYESIFEKAFEGRSLDDIDVAYLLATPPGKPLERLFAAARGLRKRVFDDLIFLYGFIYFSTYCQNFCHFCLYRRRNKAAPRYRRSVEEIVDAVRALEDTGVHLVDLTMGEDSYYLHPDGQRLIELVVRCRETSDLPLMVSPGVLMPRLLVEMARRGVDWYACYQETFNEGLFFRLRKGQDFNRRLEAKFNARQAGLLIEEGLLLGVGESRSDVILAREGMEDVGASQVRAMTFRPQSGTPMAARQAPDSLNELRTIAVLRLCFPDRLIPASLDVDGLQGLKDRLKAGANVVTSLIPPHHKLAGVSRAKSDIEEGQRTVPAVRPLIEELGLRIAPVSGYRQWIEKEKWRIGRQDRMDSKFMQPG